jgi:hypothetical protein
MRPSGQPVTGNTAFVMEGFPRSGNTFASAAFGSVKTEPFEVARHEHVPAQVIAGARAGIPVLVFIRDPESAVLSFVMRFPELTVRQALRGYIRFYSTLLPYRGRFLVATFDQVTTDFGRVIRRVNARYGSAFDVFEHTEENAAKCRAQIRQSARAAFGEGIQLELKGSFPSSIRTAAKERLRPEYLARPLARHRRNAEALYARFADDARQDARRYG